MNKRSTRLGALLTIAIWSLSYSAPVYAEGSFGENFLNAVIEEVTKEIEGDTNQKNDNPASTSATTTTSATTSNTTPVENTSDGSSSDVVVVSAPLKDERPNKEGYLREQYRDWGASAETFYTGDDELRTHCYISTGGDGDSSISIAVSNGDVLPPYAMPSIEYDEATARGYPTQIQENQEVTWVIDTGSALHQYKGETYTGYESGIPYAQSVIHSSTRNSDALGALRAFAKGNQVVLLDEYSGGDLYVGSLSGFSAAYRKMAAWCGFSPDNVFN